MRRLIRANAVVCSVALIVGLVWALAINAGEAPKHVRIIYTNDTLGYLEPCG